MPNLNTTRSELEQVFIARWGVTTPIAHDNSNYKDNVNESFVKFTVDFSASANVCLGASLPATARQRHSGFLKLVIYTPLNAGTGEAYSLSDTYKEFMDNDTIATDIFTGATDVRRSGEQVDGFFSLICFTEFTSDE